MEDEKLREAQYARFFVTFDLDAKGEVARVLNTLGMIENAHYCSVGLNTPGMDNIEGLLPSMVRTAVFSANADLVQQAMAANSDASRSAKQHLKRLQLGEFKKQATPGDEYYGQFYKLARVINKALG